MRVVSILLLASLNLAAREEEAVLPPVRDDSPAQIGPVTPVPLPTDADLFDADALAPATPTSVDINYADGFDIIRASRTVISRGPLTAVADTGMTLRADNGRYEGRTGIMTVTGSVKLRTEKGAEIFADKGVLDDAAQIVTLTGDVAIYQNGSLQRGERVVYHMEDDRIEGTGLRTSVDPLVLESGEFRTEMRDGEQVFIGEDAGVTTHDVEKPGFWLRSDLTTVYPEDRVTFKNLRFYAGGTPIFWLPYLSQPLDADLGYHFTPGGRSNWGVYLLNSYGIMLGEGDPATGDDPWLLSRWNFDLRSKRGLAGGLDLHDTRTEEIRALEGLSLYYANDLDATISRTGISRPPINEDRWRAALLYRVPLPFEDGERWRLDSNLTALSDNFFLEDFDPSTFSTNPNPDNTLGLFRRDDASLFGVVARVRPNDFYRSETRLPEITFDQARRPLFGTPVLHEGLTSLAFIREEIGSATAANVRTALALPPGDPRLRRLLSRIPTYERQLVAALRGLSPGSPRAAALRTQLLDPGFNRFHTYQELSLPTSVGGWLHLTPEVGVGYSHYSTVNGPSNTINRTHFYAGTEASLKFTKNFGPLRDRKWGLDGLLHVFQPYSQFSYLNTDDLSPLFPGVDRETFTTRPRTLDPSRFTAIDSLRDWSIIRLGMRNRLITKRDERSFDWLFLDTYFDGYLNDPDFNRNLSNLYNDLQWQPLPWLRLNLSTQFPVIDDGNGFSELASRFTFMPNENIQFTVGNRILDNHPVLIDSNRFDLTAYARLTAKWGIGATQVWEFDDRTLELQQYTLHRDFNHWVASIGFSSRDNRLETEYGVVLSFTLKDFPSASLPLKLDAP